MNLEDFQGVPLREWIAQDATRREIKRRFQSFLLTFQVWMDSDLGGKSDLNVTCWRPAGRFSDRLVPPLCARGQEGERGADFAFAGGDALSLALTIGSMPRCLTT